LEHSGDTADSAADEARARWQRLTELIAIADRRGLKVLAPQQLDEFARLYRRAVADLASERSRSRDPRLAEYLNNLVGRAAGLIYGGRIRRRINLWEFFSVTMPRTFRRTWPYTAVAFAVFAAPAAVTYVAAASNPAWADALFRPWLSSIVEEFLSRDVPPGQYFADSQSLMGADNLSGAIAVNNIKVALTAFALGITLGLGTLYILMSTGLMVGGFVGVGAHHGRVADLVGIIAPHGFLELWAIFVCGGGGLMLGWALIAPGDRTRLQALTDAAREAVVLVAGAVAMLAVAAVVEGVLSPQTGGLLRTNSMRTAFGLMLWLASCVWLLWGGRGARRSGPWTGESSPGATTGPGA